MNRALSGRGSGAMPGDGNRLSGYTEKIDGASPADLVYVNLNRGRDRAESIGSLAERLQLPRRAVESAVEALRRNGSPICTGSAGVWLTDDPDELLDHYRRLRRRAIHQLANLRAMQRTAATMRGYQQTTLWDAA